MQLREKSIDTGEVSGDGIGKDIENESRDVIAVRVWSRGYGFMESGAQGIGEDANTVLLC